jgi:hypothetical protein
VAVLFWIGVLLFLGVGGFLVGHLVGLLLIPRGVRWVGSRLTRRSRISRLQSVPGRCVARLRPVGVSPHRSTTAFGVVLRCCCSSPNRAKKSGPLRKAPS